ncbi:LacI family DNA-binding transcriptional regulator [Planococcus shenhongbingii]|uniref:LacI family DNA-binding transcriptional regulator n=1 Tax=Planococcus shenhongbingii TaxID=3058398 RepID=A0ABT8N9D6_9BACL|nr:LacI family DNA-binding transcriptional regulator [Planococcus sp. N017]MDN7244500.1 LacI family DNA-binding transcriptional regulator [Planococcus sp. N017]
MKQAITAKDVAKLAGVSQSSVSRVFFDGAKVSEKTRAKIMAAAEQLGYRPNEFARSLITNRTRIIGMVMKGVQNPFYPQVLKQFATAFKEEGYSILYVHTNNDEIEAEDVETLLNYNVAGVIITDAAMASTVEKQFEVNKIPVVFFNRKLNTDEFYSVCCNNVDAGRKIAEFLINKGATDMAYITGDEKTSTSRERQRGFQEILDQRKIAYRQFASDYTYNGGYQTAMQIIGKESLPAAFFVANDIMALGVLDALKNSGIKIPEDTKVIGFDNIDMASWPAYQLTTWEQPIEKMVETTVAYLLNEIAEYTGLAEVVEVDGSLIERFTT